MNTMLQLVVSACGPSARRLSQGGVILIFAAAVFWAPHAGAAEGAKETIGPEAMLPPLPGAAYWSSVSTFTPGSNETVTLNPPTFSWLPAPGPGFNAGVDMNLYNYVFQLDYTGAFTNPIVNVQTTCFGYNYLAPLTQSPVYWRVGYVLTNGVTNCWETNSFNLAANATNWDRSMLADPNYMALHCAHPHLLFNAENLPALSQFVQTNDPASWANVTNQAFQTIASSWWTNASPWTNTMPLNPDEDSRGMAVADVAFVWEMTGNPVFTNGLVDNFNREVNYFVEGQRWALDYSEADKYLLWSIGFGYDWLYSMLTSDARTNALNAMDLVWQCDLYGGYHWCPGNPNQSRPPFQGPFYAPYSIDGKTSTPHYFIAAMFEWMTALSAYNDHPDARRLFDVDFNTMLARKSPIGSEAAVSTSRSYAYYMTMWNSVFNNILWASMAFPEAKLNQDPYWARNVDWWMRMVPPGYNQIQEQFGGMNLWIGNLMWGYPVFTDLASFVSNGVAITQVNSERSLVGGVQASVGFNSIMDRFYYPKPTPSTNAPLGTVYPTDGWAFGSDSPPGSAAGFEKGVGFIMMARPEGGFRGHSADNDLDFEIWAYGANVTEGPGGYNDADNVSWCHNTVAINGLGQCATTEGPLAPVYSAFVAFTNAPDYIYCAADGTYTYPHVPWYNSDDPSIQGLPAQYHSLLSDGTVLSSVSKVQRHLLFVHHKYFVIYDDLAATNAVSWEWVYHVHWNTVSNFTPGGSFTYSLPQMGPFAGQVNTASNVTVYVAQIVDPNLVTATNLTGQLAYANPVTGENYYAAATNDVGGNQSNLMTNSVWVDSITPTNRFHFMTVIYPVPPGGAPPVIKRIDDFTVAVTNGADGDVISFDPNTTNAATVLVSTPLQMSPATVLPSPPTPTYTNGQQTVVRTAPAVFLGPSGLHVVPALAKSRTVNSLPGGGFAPISGYLAWWNPDTLSGAMYAPVSSWVDCSLNAWLASQSAFVQQPTLQVGTQNGHNLLSFGPVGGYLRCPSLTISSSPLEIFVVCREASCAGGAFTYLLGDDSGAPSQYTLFDGQGRFNMYLGAGDGNSAAFSGADSTNLYVLTGLFDGANSQVWTNGVLAGTGTLSTMAVIQGLGIGGRNGVASWNGLVGDVILYTNVLSSGDRQTIEAGLRAKYGF